MEMKLIKLTLKLVCKIVFVFNRYSWKDDTLFVVDVGFCFASLCIWHRKAMLRSMKWGKTNNNHTFELNWNGENGELVYYFVYCNGIIWISDTEMYIGYEEGRRCVCDETLQNALHKPLIEIHDICSMISLTKK